MAKSILMYGQDRELLESRTWVLETRRYHVVTARQISDVLGASETDAFDLLILCHSVSENECELVRILATSRWPSIRSLVLHAGPSVSLSRLSGLFCTFGDTPQQSLEAHNLRLNIEDLRGRKLTA
jgi:predicted esterase